MELSNSNCRKANVQIQDNLMNIVYVFNIKQVC